MIRDKKSVWNNKGLWGMAFFCASSAGVMSAFFIFWLHKKESDIRSTPYYKETMKLWMENESAKYIIGEPITLKPVEKDNRANYITGEKAKFFIPFSGKNYNGKMNVNATCKDKKWTLHELNFELDRDLADKKFVIYREKTATSKESQESDNQQERQKAKSAAATDDSKKLPQSKE